MSRRSASDTTGLVVVDKPPGWTSHDVVAKLRRVYGQRRTGHAGTLDPDATGVLLVGLGRLTRLLRFLQESTKAYTGTVVFGTATDTLDASGVVIEREPMDLDTDDVIAASRRFVGEIFQVPPMVSALKVGGRRLHELAREGKQVEREPRPVRIDSIEIRRFEDGPYPEAEIDVVCGSGTYIRTLAADMGAALGGCAHLRDLRRTRVGSFGLDEARSIDEIAARPERALLTASEAMRDLETVTVPDDTAAAVAHGATFPASALLAAGSGPGPFAIHDDAGQLLAVYERRGSGVKPSVVVTTGRESVR